MFKPDEVAAFDELYLRVWVGDVGRLLVPLLDDEHVVLVLVRIGRHLETVSKKRVKGQGMNLLSFKANICNNELFSYSLTDWLTY